MVISFGGTWSASSLVTNTLDNEGDVLVFESLLQRKSNSFAKKAKLKEISSPAGNNLRRKQTKGRESCGHLEGRLWF
jgi:hypothetical protein